MADIKICDRCGKKIETKAWPVYIKNIRSILSFEDSDYTYKYDLCGGCTKDLDEFVTNGITEGSTEE